MTHVPLTTQRLHLRDRVVQLSSSSSADSGAGILLCPGFIQNRHAFESPTLSLIAFLRDLGLAVHVLEVHGRHRQLPGRRTDALADYVEHDVEPVVEMLLGRHDKLAYLGHSMGGLLGVAMRTELSARLAAMITIGSPMLPGAHIPGVDLAALAAPWRRTVNGLARRVAKGLHRAGAPFPGVQAGRALGRASAVLDRPYVRHPFQVWAPGSFHEGDLAPYLKASFAEDSFGVAADLLELGRTRGKRGGALDFDARLRALETPLLVVGGNLDGLAPPKSVTVLYDRAGTTDKSLLIVGNRVRGEHFGHVDLLVGHRAPAAVWRPIADFLRPRLGLKAAPTQA